jgi:hypothetical protein
VAVTTDGGYGSRPDRLPPRMLRVARPGPTGDRPVIWVDRPGVELLEPAEHLRYERETLGRCPRHPDGTVDWEELAGGSVLLSADSESIELPSVVRAYVTPGSAVVLLWDRPEVPSLRTTAELAAEWLPEITKSLHEFWMFAPDDGLLLEQSPSGQVTVARLPAAGHATDPT